jgi:hypothetical protein
MPLYVSNIPVLTVSCKVSNFVFQILLLLVPETPTSFRLTPFVWIGSCNHCNLACFLSYNSSEIHPQPMTSAAHRLFQSCESV